MLEYTETDKNLFNAALAGMLDGHPVFVTRWLSGSAAFPAIPLTNYVSDVNDNVTVIEMCFTCIRVQNADNASIAAYVEGFALKKTSTYNPDTGTSSSSFTRTVISRALQFST
jgi:hypothetical protein